MPSVKDNLSMWDKNYDWQERGEVWSAAWGSALAQWYGSLLPRIHPFVRAPTILEIAPGFGRWTQYLKDLCDQLILVDLSEKCIEACKARFKDSSHISYFVNDGKSLSMVEDESIDFVFCFDSLVHAEEDVLASYASEFGRLLKNNGVAFIHHSNLGNYSTYRQLYSLVTKVPKLPGLLNLFGVDNVAWQWRAPSMTAEKMVQFCDNNGLVCVGQELTTWNTRHVLIDCVSIIVRKGSIWERERIVVKNPNFMREASHLAEISNVYDLSKKSA